MALPRLLNTGHVETAKDILPPRVGATVRVAVNQIIPRITQSGVLSHPRIGTVQVNADIPIIECLVLTHRVAATKEKKAAIAVLLGHILDQCQVLSVRVEEAEQGI